LQYNRHDAVDTVVVACLVAIRAIDNLS
jgi:hypothetical protein